jgi:hypothetical protein
MGRAMARKLLCESGSRKWWPIVTLTALLAGGCTAYSGYEFRGQLQNSDGSPAPAGTRMRLGPGRPLDPIAYDSPEESERLPYVKRETCTGTDGRFEWTWRQGPFWALEYPGVWELKSVFVWVFANGQWRFFEVSTEKLPQPHVQYGVIKIDLGRVVIPSK